MKVKDISEEAIFVSDSQDVQAIRESIGEDAYGFDSFFVIATNGDYEGVWGMCGIIPYLDNDAVQLI